MPCWWIGWWLWRAGYISQDTYLLYLRHPVEWLKVQKYFIVQMLSKLPSIALVGDSYNKTSYWYLMSWVHAQLFSRLPVECSNIIVVVSNSNHSVENRCNQHDGWKDTHFWNIIERSKDGKQNIQQKNWTRVIRRWTAPYQWSETSPATFFSNNCSRPGTGFEFGLQSSFYQFPDIRIC